ncbi:hypothetical protein A8L34_24740 [Bacillus sp. FJAT-27264]|uniref:methyltransferase domain-containing protein n=1 Tax=Paenibacillus sp. (strain DSM 101736 / FJAT-27264) TaxID=1850362 RepID=UPI000807A912|nr:methyltransferase domain-containing protein [Bacillus sp. FJAT-27264]OBZ07843.1 hypothetical protein A8L34_24740 [Bacillus sp. FJAT-27264]
MSNSIFENEAWWQENGLGWADEVDKRRSLQPLYGIQEVVLTHIFSNMTEQTKVLEFGVGFGRHIDYLSDIANVDIHGVDQSPTMIESLKKRLAHKDELFEKIVLIEPRTQLPYPDGYFDFVYTVSVLIHINPNDLEGILKELIRVSKHGIIHFENNYAEYSELKFPDHNGCWQHSIVHDYSKLNLSCSVLSKVASEQDIYYIQLSDKWNKEDLEDKVLFSRLYLMDQKIRPTIAKFEGEIGWRSEELKKRIENEFQMNQVLSESQQTISELQQRIIEEEQKNINIEEKNKQQELQISSLQDEKGKVDEKYNQLNKMYNECLVLLASLEDQYSNEKATAQRLSQEVTQLISNKVHLETRLFDIESSLAWRVITKLRSMDRLYRLSKPARKLLHIGRNFRLRSKGQAIENAVSEIIEPNVTSTEIKNKRYAWLDTILKAMPEGANIAIHQPEWLGVSHSTKELFPHTVPIKELYDSNNIQLIGKYIANRKPKAIIFSGFAIGYYELAKVLKQLDHNISIKVYWHGNTTHMYEDYSWSRYQEIIQLCDEGIVDGWGFAKESMAQLYGKNGYPSYFVKNTVKDVVVIQTPKARANTNDVKIGIYASGNTWNKNAYTQIAAVSLIKNASINAVPFNSRMKSFAQQLKIDFDGSENPVSREELLNRISSNDINLYVTFSECAPLLPLESMNLGVPCLTGPNHHYFDGSPLKDYLMVNRPDDPVEIAEKAEHALKNRKEIMDLYNEWKQQNDTASELSIISFVEGE